MIMLVDPIDALLHEPVFAPWDPNMMVWAPASYKVRCGHAGESRWATDGSTIAMAPCTEPYEDQIEPSAAMAEKVLRWMSADVAAPMYSVRTRDLAYLGGVGEIPVFGLFHLDRLQQAAVWVASSSDDTEDVSETVVVAAATELGGLNNCNADLPMATPMRIFGPSGRHALVLGMQPKPERADYWRPRIDLPLEIATP